MLDTAFITPLVSGYIANEQGQSVNLGRFWWFITSIFHDGFVIMTLTTPRSQHLGIGSHANKVLYLFTLTLMICGQTLQTYAIRKWTLALGSLVSNFFLVSPVSCQVGLSAVFQKYPCIFNKKH